MILLPLCVKSLITLHLHCCNLSHRNTLNLTDVFLEYEG